MAEKIDYYFTCVSPFAYLGHRALLEMADKTGVEIKFKPFNMMDVWSVSEAVPPFKRPIVRQKYRLLELQRAAKYRGLDLNPKPTNFPTDPSRADLCCAALVLAGENPAKFLGKVGEALWVNDQQIADEEVLGSILEAQGYNATQTLYASNGDEASNLRNQNSDEAIAADAIGAPAYVYKGEVFWGQDRIEYLQAMIEEGRDAYSAE